MCSYEKYFISFLLAFWTMPAWGWADDPVFSGPQPGESLAPFQARLVSGPDAEPGQEIDVLKTLDGAPMVLVFVHEITRPAFQLMRPIDRYGAKHSDDGLQTRFIWLAEDLNETEAFLKRARNSLDLQSPILISLDGAEGPGDYGLNRNVTLTILVAKENQVSANFALVQPNETDAPEVLAEIAQLIDQPPPSLEVIHREFDGQGEMTRMQAQPRPRPSDGSTPSDSERLAALERQVLLLTEALNQARARLAALEGTLPPSPIQPLPTVPPGIRPELPGRGSPDPQLQGLMRRMLMPGINEATVTAVAEEMAKWAGDDPEKRQQLAEACRRIIAADFGTEAAQTALLRLANREPEP